MSRDALVRIAGIVLSILYAAAIGWLYVQQPQTAAQVTGGFAATMGVYRIDQQSFDDGLRFFRRGEYAAARSAFARADSAGRDAATQFYIAYAFYREGWGRTYHDDALFTQGLEAVGRAIALAPQHRLVVDDADLGMKSADELKAELEAGLRRDASDFNPLRTLDKRK